MSSSEVITASSAAINVIKKHKLNPYLLISESTSHEFEPYYSKQLNCIKSYYNSNNINDKLNILNNNFDSVFIGLAPELLNYNNLNIAFRILHYNNNNPKLYEQNFFY